MGILLTIVIGFVIGLTAKFLMPGRDPGGFIITSLLGIAGSLTASYLGHAFGFYQFGEPVGFIAAVIGAMLLLGIYRALANRHSMTH